MTTTHWVAIVCALIVGVNLCLIAWAVHDAARSVACAVGELAAAVRERAGTAVAD